MPAASVDAFFHEMVTDALADRGVTATETTEFYLVGLLGEFTRARLPDEPLAIKLVEAERAQDPGTSVRALKEVGDTTLYLSGFFQDSLEQKLVAVDYYIGLGESAYSSLAARLASSSVAEVYRELAGGFPGFVEVLSAVRGKVHVDNDVASLYQRWLDTRDESVAERLRGMGVVLPANDDDYVQ